MRKAGTYLVFLSALAGSLSATSVLTCSFNGGPFSSVGCYTSPSFFTTTTSDWLAALGPADQAPHDVVASGPWQHTTSDGVVVGVTEGPGYSGATDNLLRVDNFAQYFDAATNSWHAYNEPGSPFINYNTVQSFFDAPPDSGAGSPGDHLIATSEAQGPLEIQFRRGINGVMFRISTPTSTDVVATIAAYSQLNPTTNDTPLMTYSVLATNAAGVCYSLGDTTPPVPCNVAPFIGIEGLPGTIRSVVVSTTDSGGMYLGSLFIDSNALELPEPGTFNLIGGALLALLLTSRRRTSRS